MEKNYKNIGFWLLLLIPITILAFYKPYFQYLPNFIDIKTTIHIHAFIASVWIFLLILQPILLLRNKYKAHRIIGKLSYVWFPILIASFIPLMRDVLKSEFPKAIFFSSADVVLLILFYSLAIFHRKRVHLHMRYMILTALVFLGPTIARIGGMWLDLPLLKSQGILYFLIAIILSTLITRDGPKWRTAKPYITGAICYMVHALIFYTLFI